MVRVFLLAGRCTWLAMATGTALDECLQDYCNWDDAARARIRAYTLQLETTIVDKVAEAFGRLAPATLWAGEGVTGFAVNRRNNSEAEVSKILARGEKPKGPVDHAIPVLAVKSRDGKWTAVLFGYACHTTTRSRYRWSGDFTGFAMIELQRAHPGSQAMFFQGCGTDRNPIPRHTVELCEKYGKMLAKGVEETLRKPMRPLAPTLRWTRDLEERLDAAVEKVVAAVGK